MLSTPFLDFFKRGGVAKDVRMLAAQGALAPRAKEQLALLVLLLEDADPDVRQTADATVKRIPVDAVRKFLARSDVPAALLEFFADRGVFPDEVPLLDTVVDEDEPLIDTSDDETAGEEDKSSESIVQQVGGMSFTQRLKAAMKGAREVRAILIRDPNKMIAAAVLSSPKLTEPEVESFARMANVSEDVLRTIGATRAWMKNYSIVVALAKNPKTPVALSLNLVSRLGDRDLNHLSVDRNVPEPVRVAARKRVVSGSGRK